MKSGIPTSEVIEAGLLPYLIKYASYEHEQLIDLRCEVTWIL